MIHIICGEDTVASRAYLSVQKRAFREKGYEVMDIPPSDIGAIVSWIGQNPGLFAAKRVYVISYLDKTITKSNRKNIDELKKLSTKSDIDLLIWEEKPARLLKIAKVGKVWEFKLPKTIFKLQESCYPSNKKQFISLFHTLLETQDPHFIFIMLVRHIRNLILIKSGSKIPALAPWQASKLVYQAGFWKLEHLIYFYEGLFKIEKGGKSSSFPYSIA